MVGIMVGMMVGMMVGLSPGLPSFFLFIYAGFRRPMVGMLGLLRKIIFCNILSFQNYSLSLHYRLLVLRGKAGGLIL